jgi:hypothetical protein
MINNKALSLAGKTLYDNLNSLRDLPYELANTLANIYYRFFLIIEDPTCDSIYFDPYIVRSNNNLVVFENLQKFKSETNSFFGEAANLTRSAREVRLEREELFEYLVEILLDVMKFNIEGAQSKIPLRRRIERKFKTPKEIPCLIDKMRAHGFDL